MAVRLEFSVSFIRTICHYAASQGYDVDRLCRLAEFPRSLLSDPDCMVSNSVIEKVWQVALSETGDPNFGLHTGEHIQPSDLGMLGFAMVASPSLGGALRKLIRYWALLSNASSITLTEADDTAVLQLHVIDLPGNLLAHNRHPVDSSYSSAMSLVRAMAGRPLPLLDVACTYPPPADTREYERILGRRVRFDAAVNIMSFPAEALHWPLLHTNSGVGMTLEEHLQRRVNRIANTLRDRVQGEVARRLSAEVPNLTTVARALGTSPRALQRDLQREGTSFRQVVDDLRKDLAAEYLGEPQHSITDVSFLLGFSEPSVLHRYFRRWYGVTPVSYRHTRIGLRPESPGLQARSTTRTR